MIYNQFKLIFKKIKYFKILLNKISKIITFFNKKILNLMFN